MRTEEARAHLVLRRNFPVSERVSLSIYESWLPEDHLPTAQLQIPPLSAQTSHTSERKHYGTTLSVEAHRKLLHVAAGLLDECLSLVLLHL